LREHQASLAIQIVCKHGPDMSADAEIFCRSQPFGRQSGFVFGLTNIHGFEKLPCRHAKA
jgi:hypothetical protein